MAGLLKTIRRMNEGIMWVAGIIIFIMAILLFYAIVMRYFFEKPPSWSFDLTGWFTGLSAFLAGGYALAHGAHVRVDMIYEKFSLRTRSLIDIITSIFLFLIVIVLVWKGMEQVLFNYETNAMASTGLNVPIWLKWLMIPLGGLLLGLQAMINLIKDIYIVVKGKPIEEEGTS
ncbi:MAG TPA: TRAP transporter small permease subunit [Chondromyces sp.]|nr:TRAP transporter small permease subunit [Chondromyces sp.]